jgi:hypothetical protein
MNQKALAAWLQLATQLGTDEIFRQLFEENDDSQVFCGVRHEESRKRS